MSETQSVYQLITRLCTCLIKESDEQLDINRIKSVAFRELLTSDCEKSSIDREKLLSEVEFVTFELKLAKKLRESNELVEFSENLDEELQSMFWLLLSLRSIDPEETSRMKVSCAQFCLTRWKIFTFNFLPLQNEKHFFKLPTNLAQLNLKNAYLSPSKSSTGKLIQLQTSSAATTPSIDEHNFFADIIESATGMKKTKCYQFPASKSPQPPPRRVEVAPIAPTKVHFNWENLDYESSTENSFTSEASGAYLRLSAMKEQRKTKEIVRIPFEKLLNDIRLLTIGVESETFKRTAADLTFELAVDVTCGNISSLHPFIDEFLEAGSCFRRLKTFTSKKVFNQNYFLEGFIFKAFCDCLVKFMNSYRDIVYSQHVDTLLEFAQNTRDIRTILIHITKFLNIHPSFRHIRTKLPVGSDFLNFLYQEYTTIVCESTLCFFVECLKSCSQIYFANFQKWVFHATLDDRYKELFIYFNNQYRPNTKYFFDRAYLIRKSSVPSFLQGCADEILLCGKYTMLLRSFNQVHPLFTVPKPQIRVCMTDDEIAELIAESKAFIQHARVVCGRRISIEAVLNEMHTENAERYKRSEEASVRNFVRWMQEQSEIQRVNNERRELQMQNYRAGMEKIEEQKMLKRMKEIQAEKDFLDEMASVEEEQTRRENEATRKRIEIYQKLNDDLDVEIERKNKLIENLQQNGNADEINANLITLNPTNEQIKVEENIAKQKLDDLNNLIESATSTHAEAQRNRDRVMSHEYNLPSVTEETNDQNGNEQSQKTLTEAQRNKLKVMGHEFELIESENTEKSTPKISVIVQQSDDGLTDLQRNRQKVMSGEYFLEQSKPVARLNLLPTSPRISQILESPISDIMAMSVTSDHFSSDHHESSELRDSDKSDEKIEELDEHPEDDDLFRAFEEAIEKNSSHFLGADLSQVSTSTSYECIKSTNTLEMSRYLQQSIMIPVNAYMEMLNNETLKMFIENLKIISHFKSLRNYFLMMNGEFSISVCHQLFTKLEKGVKPLELFNYQSLHMILDHALSNARHDENTEQLSFIVKNVPEKFETFSPAVLSGITLSYKLEWPLNL